MKIVRRNCFETNSSSCHSLSILNPGIKIHSIDKLEFIGGEFGWSGPDCESPQEKFSYVVSLAVSKYLWNDQLKLGEFVKRLFRESTTFSNMMTWLEEEGIQVMIDEEAVLDSDVDWYVDHNSEYLLESKGVFANKSNFLNFLLSDTKIIISD